MKWIVPLLASLALSLPALADDAALGNVTGAGADEVYIYTDKDLIPTKLTKAQFNTLIGQRTPITAEKSGRGLYRISLPESADPKVTAGFYWVQRMHVNIDRQQTSAVVCSKLASSRPSTQQVAASLGAGPVCQPAP